MVNDQQGSILSDQEMTTKGRWKECTENLYKRDKNMADTFEGASYEEEFVILEIEVKAALKLFGRNKSPGVGEILI